MPFPKFTSGRSGRLTFDTLNELFSRVEKLEADARPAGMQLPQMKHAIFARVTAQNTAPNQHQYSFAEVCRQNPQTAYGSTFDPAAWIPVTGGQTSAGVNVGAGTTVSSFRYPLIGSGLTVGTIVPIVATATGTGDLVYIPIQASGGTVSFPARIVGNTSIATNVRWLYTLQKVSVSGNTLVDSSGSQITALNGAETVTDSAPVFGVGMQPPTSPTLQMIRQPIKTGVVVVVTDDGLGKYVFSMPNGYKVIC